MRGAVEVPVEALASAFLDEHVPVDDALDALTEWTRYLIDQTHFLETGEMADDGIGFSKADYVPAQQYLEAVDHAEERGAELPVALHAAWARRLHRYGATQLGGKDRVLRFINRLQAEANARGETHIEKVRTIAPTTVQGGGKTVAARDDRTGRAVYGAVMPRGTHLRDLLSRLNLPPNVARMSRSTWADGSGWMVSIDPAHVDAFADALERFDAAAYGAMAQALRDVAPVWRADAGVGVERTQAAAVPAPVTEPTGMVFATGRAYHAFSWSPENPAYFAYVTDYDTFERSKAALRDIPQTLQVQQARGHPSASRDGRVFWRVVDVADAGRLADALQPYSPDLAQGIREASRVWASRQPVIDDDTQFRAAALVRQFEHLMDPDIKADAHARAALLRGVAEVLPALLRIQPGQTEADIGAYGGWDVETRGGTVSLRLRVPYAYFRWEQKGPKDQDGRRVPLKGIKARRDENNRWYQPVPVKQLARVTQALDVAGNLPLATALRLAFFVDEQIRSSDLRLQQISRAPTVKDIADPTLRAEIEALGDRLDALMPLRLRPFQRLGPAFVYYAAQDRTRTGARVYIGDAMGLGKTPQAIAALLLDRVVDMRGPMTPALVIAPTSVVHQWPQEIVKFAGSYLRPIVVRTAADLPARVDYGDVLVVPSSMVVALEQELAHYPFRTLVADEAHYFKNVSAKRTKAAGAIAHAVPNAIFLSGTPLPNQPEDLWAQVNALDTTIFPSYQDFKARFGSLRAKGDTRMIDGDELAAKAGKSRGTTKRRIQVAGVNVAVDMPAKSREELIEEISDTIAGLFLRRTKDQVLSELPPKTQAYRDVMFEGAALKTYVKVLDEFAAIACANWVRRMALKAARAMERDGWSLADAVAWANAQRVDSQGDGGDGAEILQKLGALRQTAGRLKVPAAVEWAEEHKASSPDDPAIIFTAHVDVANAIGSALAQQGFRVAVLTGATPSAQRPAIFEALQRAEIDFLVATQALREGVNLQRAADVLFAERWWRPGDEEQAEDRVYRIGQGRPVQITYLNAVGTVDDYMRSLLDAKRQNAADLFGAEAVRQAAGVIDALPPQWRSFAARHARALGLESATVVGEGSNASLVASIVGSLLGDLQRAGKCAVTAKDVRAAAKALRSA